MIDMDAILRYGAYVCVRWDLGSGEELATIGVLELAKRFGLENEFWANVTPTDAVALYRRVEVAAGDIVDDDLALARAIIYVASGSEAPVAAFCRQLTSALGNAVTRTYRGVVRPTSFSGNAMYDFAYAHQVVQQPGTVMPNAFIVPIRKTPAWWSKDWMERHTYFLPRFDRDGEMTAPGHVLSAAPGIPCLLRRTYRSLVHPAPTGEYDFFNYFECAGKDVATFHEVCQSLRDTRGNPEWDYVREGPTWHGERVATWGELFKT